MRWPLLRRCLLFATLGLITSVAVAWGLSVHAQVWRGFEWGNREGFAVVGDTIIWLQIDRRPGFCNEWWQLDDPAIESHRQYRLQAMAQSIRDSGGAAYAEWLQKQADEWAVSEGHGPSTEMPSRIRVDECAALGPPIAVEDIANGSTSIWRTSVGWPLLALCSGGRQDLIHDGPSSHTELQDPRPVVSYEMDVEIPWPLRTTGAGGLPPATVRFPLAPRPGLLLNTIFYALLWAIILLAPGAIRRRIRRARGRCPTCGYSLAGQSTPGCPECGEGQEAGVERSRGVAKRRGGPAPA